MDGALDPGILTRNTAGGIEVSDFEKVLRAMRLIVSARWTQIPNVKIW